MCPTYPLLCGVPRNETSPERAPGISAEVGVDIPTVISFGCAVFPLRNKFRISAPAVEVLVTFCVKLTGP